MILKELKLELQEKPKKPIQIMNSWYAFFISPYSRESGISEQPPP
jgi:hypothetical protein